MDGHNMRPMVDVVIATIGRRSLEQAILAAVNQTYEKARVVVVGDGPCDPARMSVAIKFRQLRC